MWQLAELCASKSTQNLSLSPNSQTTKAFKTDNFCILQTHTMTKANNKATKSDSFIIEMDQLLKQQRDENEANQARKEPKSQSFIIKQSQKHSNKMSYKRLFAILAITMMVVMDLNYYFHPFQSHINNGRKIT